MLRRFRLFVGRIAFVAVAMAGALSPVACASVLGIDDGRPRATSADGSDDGTTDRDASSDATQDGSEAGLGVEAGDAALDARAEAGNGGDAADAGDARDPADAADARSLDGGDGCVPDPAWCKTHCAPGVDNCGLERACADNCNGSWSCDLSTRQCTCKSDPNWCTGRCGAMSDNCGVPVDCGGCGGALACTSNTCGCVPNPNPCGTMQCGQTVDSCNHPVSCGANGMCASGGICNTSSGTCCTPLADPCAGRCGVSVDDGCGQTVLCPPKCPAPGICDSQNTCCTPGSCGNSCGVINDGCGQPLTCSCPGSDVCYQGQCCVPSGAPCSPTCVDNCGQSVPCCGPPDAGGCGALGASCPGGQGCCSGYCDSVADCVSFCSGQNGGCSSTSDCCFGLTCTVTPTPDGGLSSDGGAAAMSQFPTMGWCQ